MANLGLNVANDIASAILKHYARGKTLAQTIQERPLLRFLNAGKKTFPGGNQFISDPIQGTYMSDGTAILGGGAFFSGFQEDTTVSFAQAANIKRAEYQWFEVHAGLVITWTELKKDGISIVDHSVKREHADMALTKLTDLLENRMDDFGESWARSINLMLWKDGSQDALQVPGVNALITENPAVGTTGTVDRVANVWWRNLAFLNIAASEQSQLLTKTLRAKQRPLRRFMGKPSKFLCGSSFLDSLEMELQAKGLYTESGFANEGRTDIGMADISLRGVGKFEYDPTLDDLGQSKYCYEFDSRRLKLRPMEGEDNKILTPERPYANFVFLKSMTWTGALQATQLNCHAVFTTV